MSNLRKALNREINNLLQNNKHLISKNLVDTLMILRFEDNHTHFVFPDESHTKDLIESLIGEAESMDISLHKNANDTQFEDSIIFRNKQAIGDVLMMTCAIRDFKKANPNCRVNVITTAAHIWDNNPYIDRLLTEKDARIVDIGPSYLTNASNKDDRHFVNAYRISIENNLNINIPQGNTKPDIWMTEEELNDELMIEPPYWIITAGEKGDWTSKTYPFSRWQQVVNMLPEITFVQIGAKEHKHFILEGANVVNLIGKTQNKNTGIRDLFKLFYNAEGSVGLVSFHMHLAAAFNLPCVVVAGAREPARFTKYPGHQYLSTDGCLPCAENNACWSCDMDKTCKSVVDLKDGTKIPKCVDLIKPEEIVKAIDNYYEGGRLIDDAHRKPTPPNPPEKTIKLVIEKLKEDPITVDGFNPQNFGFEWGRDQITEKDCAFINSVLEDYPIDNVLEFGSGISTLFFADKVSDVITFEAEESKIYKLRPLITDNVKLNLWDGKHVPDKLVKSKFDFVFVNGPSGGKNREISIKIASQISDIVIVHDGGRKWEQEWQDKYMKGKFDLVQKGGHRCHLWAKEGVNAVSYSLMTNEDGSQEVHGIITKPAPGKKLFKMVFNGRGEGGAERSTTWIMNKFIEMGWNVQYICAQGPSGTFRKEGHKSIAVGDDEHDHIMSCIEDSCDILMLYTNDWVWEFGKDPFKEAFGNVHANRKVMAVNFRLGDIGSIEWTKGWDQYLFLNTSLEKKFLTYLPYANTKTMAPPTDISEFLKKDVDLSGSLKLIRHSSQGDTKFDKEKFEDETKAILERFPEAEIHLMPGPSFVEASDRIIKYKRNQPPVSEFLTLGNVFWYKLPEGYHDMGPKVIMEAQAVGLPVIADNHSGPKDRVNKFCGFLCNTFEEHLDAMEKLENVSTRKRLGANAKQYAEETYDPNHWIKSILGEE